MACRPPGPPYSQAEAVTPHDTTANHYCELWVGGAGDIVVHPVGSAAAVTIAAVAAGTSLPIAVKLVLITGTTATKIIGYK